MSDYTMRVATTCPICSTSSVMRVSATQFEAWERGVDIQVAMPDLSSDDREKLMTGICPPCWAAAFRVEAS